MQDKKSRSGWFENFKALGNMTELTRGVLVFAAEYIVVFDANTIRIRFKLSG